MAHPQPTIAPSPVDAEVSYSVALGSDNAQLIRVMASVRKTHELSGARIHAT
jgi:hypothetical protein